MRCGLQLMNDALARWQDAVEPVPEQDTLTKEKGYS